MTFKTDLKYIKCIYSTNMYSLPLKIQCSLGKKETEKDIIK